MLQIFLHILSCPQISQLWGKVHSVICNTLKHPINLTPANFLILHFDDSVTNNESLLINYTCFTAKTLIARNWKVNKILDFSEWLSKIHYIMLMCNLTAVCKSFISVWKPLTVFWNGKYPSKLKYYQLFEMQNIWEFFYL